MKIRTDFVSNSSSSSFIISDVGNKSFIKKFNLIKDHFKNAFNDLMLNSYEFPKILDKNDKDYLMKINHPFVDDKSYEYENDNLIYWGDDFLNSNFKKIDDKIIRQNNSENIYKWNTFYNSVRDIYNLNYVYNPYSNKMYDIELEKNVLVPDYLSNTLKNTYNKLGICTNLDVAKSIFSKLFIHFEDNDIYCIDGINEYGNKDKEYLDEEDSKCIVENDWKTETCTIDRICEILVKYFKDKGIIPNDDSITYLDLLNDIVVFEPHEG